MLPGSENIGNKAMQPSRDGCRFFNGQPIPRGGLISAVLRQNPKEHRMSTDVVEPNKWRKRIWRFTITGILMGISFAIGVAITAFIAFRLLLPIAATGMTMGMIGMASAGAHATTSALYSGDSAMRLTVLTQLQQTFDAQPSMTFDTQTSAWILPAIEQCKTDVDPDVASLAEELATYVKDKTQPAPQ
jgi:hypothetical protein